nr:immunoglobulin light chain junction region [Macaca mulatta]MOV68315.1 immunoglobulin light chain junction region [Macaca mulatta]MOV71330.1 immunoglobulin light chain junction region [Macaca mulatta]
DYYCQTWDIGIWIF